MNINRRKFFRVCAAGMAAAAVPSFLNIDKVQGKENPTFNPKTGMYAWAEHGFAVLDNRKICLGEFETLEEWEQSLDNKAKYGAVPNIVLEAPKLWNIKEGCEHNAKSLKAAMALNPYHHCANVELSKALEVPLRLGVLSGNILNEVFETRNLEHGMTNIYQSRGK